MRAANAAVFMLEVESSLLVSHGYVTVSESWAANTKASPVAASTLDFPLGRGTLDLNAVEAPLPNTSPPSAWR